MNCAQSGRLLNAYADGELELQEALAIEEHIEACGRCRRALEALHALRAALGRACEPASAPEALRARVRADLDLVGEAAGAPRGGHWRRPLLAAVPGVAALLIAGWLAFAEPWKAPPPVRETRVVFHVSSSENVGASLRTLKNHLDAAPEARVVVVAHNNGVDFLLRGARDEFGRPIEPIVRQFVEQGVEFRVCRNTLTRRGMPDREVIDEATLVPSGIAEIGRLQSREGYAYMRL